MHHLTWTVINVYNFDIHEKIDFLFPFSHFDTENVNADKIYVRLKAIMINNELKLQ